MLWILAEYFISAKALLAVSKIFLRASLRRGLVKLAHCGVEREASPSNDEITLSTDQFYIIHEIHFLRMIRIYNTHDAHF